MNKLSWALLLVLLPSVILAVNFLQDAGNRGWRLTQRQFFGVFPTPETEPFSVYDYYYNSPQSCLPDSIIRSREGEVDLIFRLSYDPAGRLSDLRNIGVGRQRESGLWYHADHDAGGRITATFLAGYTDPDTVVMYLTRQRAVYTTSGIDSLYSVNVILTAYTRSSFELDNLNQPVLELESSSADSLTWVNSKRVQWQFADAPPANVNDLLEARGCLGLWEFASGAYDIGFRPIMVTESHWDGSQWVNNTRSEYVWDLNGKLHEKQTFEWETGAWVSDEIDVYSYDDNENISFLSRYNQWGLDYVYRYTWVPLGSSIADQVQPVNPLNIAAWPVPFTDNLKVMVTGKDNQPVTIGIYNQRGQKVKQLTGRANNTLVWDGRDEHSTPCATGIYFMAAAQGTGRTVIKVVLAR